MTDDHRSPEEIHEDYLRGRLASVRSDIGGLAGRLAFADELRTVTEAHGALRELGAQITAGRARGFVYQSELEFELQDAAAMADATLVAVRQEIEKDAALLRPRADELQRRAFSPRLARGVPDEGQLDLLEQEYRAVDEAIDEAEKRVLEHARPFTELVDQLRQGVGRMTFTLDLFGNAGFTQQPDEAPLVALLAKNRDAPGGEKEGVLFLSNQRLRFEAREEKVLERKFLLFASKTETVKALLVDEPVGNIAGTEASKEGVIFKDEILTVRWGRGGKTSFELLEGEAAEAWSAVIGYICSGEIEQTRVASASPNLAPLTFPEHCTHCGAPLPAPVKGQLILTCTYCKREHAGIRP
ncbi:MAG: hypothetical protein MUF64_19410 [Polyangiaceae bacterium]|jgi:hypothetical protein|nr:hypothetical protein [Polyangiaceae bacterium]